MDDSKQLRAFVECGSESDFRKIVERHMGMVYSTAMRRLNDAGLAEEASQNVFVKLSQKAQRLGTPANLAGWLYKSTLLETSNMIRSKDRRRKRQEILTELSQTQTGGESVWGRVMPVLDEAMGCLRDRDREVLLLRYFEGCSLREVGQFLDIGEDAAQKRVSRSLSKLSQLLRRRGIAVPATVLGTQLFQTSVHSVPPALAATTIKAAVATQSAASLSSFAVNLTSQAIMTKLQATGIFLIAAALPISLQWKAIGRLKSENATLVAQRTHQEDEASKLQSQITDLNSKLSVSESMNNLPRVDSGGNNQATSPPTGDLRDVAAETADHWSVDSEIVSIGKENLRDINLDALTDRFALTDAVIDVLGLSEDEMLQLQRLIDKLKQDVKEYELANLEEIPDASEEKDDQRQTTYRVAPYTEEEQASAQDGFDQRVSGLLGKARNDLFKRFTQYELAKLFGQTEKTVTFVDHYGADGDLTETEWIINTKGPNVHGSRRGSNSDGSPLPVEVEHLFELHEP